MTRFLSSAFVCLVAALPLAIAQHAPNHELLNSVLWAQTAAEHDAASLAAYRNARDQLDRALKDKGWTAAVEQTGGYRKLPPAIILDVDETVFDNSPMEARAILKNTDWSPALWDEWVAEASERGLPGAVEFTQYARSRGVSVFFVTNRDAKHEEATRRAMKRLGIPLQPAKGPLSDTVMCRGERADWGSDKSSRRAEVALHYRVLLLVGDDLGDFASNVRTSIPARRDIVLRYRENWGSKWIILPNPMYGSWEAALYPTDSQLPRQARVGRKFDILTTKGVDPQ